MRVNGCTVNWVERWRNKMRIRTSVAAVIICQMPRTDWNEWMREGLRWGEMRLIEMLWRVVSHRIDYSISVLFVVLHVALLHSYHLIEFEFNINTCTCGKIDLNIREHWYRIAHRLMGKREPRIKHSRDCYHSTILLWCSGCRKHRNTDWIFIGNLRARIRCTRKIVSTVKSLWCARSRERARLGSNKCRGRITQSVSRQSGWPCSACENNNNNKSWYWFAHDFTFQCRKFDIRWVCVCVCVECVAFWWWCCLAAGRIQYVA